MARAHLHYYVCVKAADNTLRPVVGASALVVETNTNTPVGQTMYDAFTGGAAKANPLTSDANGLVEAWTPSSETVDLQLSGGTPAMIALVVQCKFENYDAGP